MMKINGIWAAAAAVFCAFACGKAPSVPEENDFEPQAQIRIRAARGGAGTDISVQDIVTKVPMVNYPDNGDDVTGLPEYKDPVGLFGFYVPCSRGGLHDPVTEHGTTACGYIGKSRAEILANVEAGTVSAQQAANVLGETVNGTAPERQYSCFMTNVKFMWSEEASAFVSYDMAAFWRPNAYHYFICYAPPVEQADDDFSITLKTEKRGVEGKPDFNFIYGRKVLEYNASKREDTHHQHGGIDIFVTPQLAQLSLSLRCDDNLEGQIVMYGFKLTTFNKAQFNLRTAEWTFNDADTLSIVRYYDNELVIPTQSEYAAAKAENRLSSLPRYTVSLFPNIDNQNSELVPGTSRDMIKDLKVCLNNKWYDVANIREIWEGHEGNSEGIIPLAPGMSTTGLIDIRKSSDQWNKLLVTFSNWRQEETYSYEGTLE